MQREADTRGLSRVRQDGMCKTNVDCSRLKTNLIHLRLPHLPFHGDPSRSMEVIGNRKAFVSHFLE